MSEFLPFSTCLPLPFRTAYGSAFTNKDDLKL
jgi:hypothetical protein